MNIIPAAVPGASGIARAFMEHYESVGTLYGGRFDQEEGLLARLAWLDKQEMNRADRKSLVEVLRTYNGRFNNGEAVTASLDALERPGTVVVAGGQQSGLFTGPLLVIYKAVTIIAAAREASAKLNRETVPVFWIAGEDHDWDEADHTYVLNRTGEISKLRLSPGERPRNSVSNIKVNGGEWEDAIRQLDEALQDSEFKPGIMEMVRTCLEQADSLSEAFAAMMGRLMGRYGLVLLDSADPALRKLETPMFRRLIEAGDGLEAAYAASAEDIRLAGYEPQADVNPGSANLFLIHEGERLLLYKEDGMFRDRKGRVSLSRSELIDLLEEHPERFSNNVLTRPLMQDYVLPVLGTVLGPGEIAYWAITRTAFDTLGMAMPPIVPRMSFTLVEGTVNKHMGKFGLSLDDAFGRLKDKRDEWLAEQDGLGLERKFEETKAAFEALYDPLIAEIGSMQAGLLKLGASNKEKIVEQIAFLQKKTADMLRQQNEAGLRQWERIGLSLLPLNKPQERIYNVMYYINRYGESWLEELLQAEPVFNGEHRVLYM